MFRIFKGIIFIGLFASFGSVSGQVKYALPTASNEQRIDIVNGQISGAFSITFFNYNEFGRDGENIVSLEIPEYSTDGRIGFPEFPVYSELLEIDPEYDYHFKINSIDSIQIDCSSAFTGMQFSKVRPPVRKTVDKADTSSDLYDATTTFSSSGEVLLLERLGIVRGLSIGRLQFSPFKYDEQNNVLTVYYAVSFEVTTDLISVDRTWFSDAGVFDRALSAVKRDKYSSLKKRLVRDEAITMVILSDTMFRESLQPLIEWKTRKGIKIIEAYTSDSRVGSSNMEIKEYLSEVYHTPPPGYSVPSYLLIVGDVQHVPLSQSSGQVTDLYYTTFDGDGDYLPEMFHGRISVENDTQLTNVVNKILMYERYEFPDPSFLQRSILIAGKDPQYAPLHGNGQIRYANNYYFNESNGISASVYLDPEAYQLDKEIYQDISLGAAFVNYTGHGDANGWIDPALRTAYLDTLKNNFKYPLMIGNGCRTNQFNLSSGDCFAEAVLKIKDRGAIAYVGCTNDSYWDEDFYWSVGIGKIVSTPLYENTSHGYYDKVFHLGNEEVSDWAPSLGEMIFAGNMTVQQSTSKLKKYYWEIYQLMGDPSLVPWFSVPEEQMVAFPETVPSGAKKISIEASPYNYIALTMNNEIVAAMHADEYGQAYFSLPDGLGEEDLSMVVTGDYHVPFEDSIKRNGLSEGYIELAGYEITDESVRSDHLLSRGEEFSINLSIFNSGSQPIQTSELLLECKDEQIVIIDSLVAIPAIGTGDTLELTGAFRMQVSQTIADSSTFRLKIGRYSDNLENSVFITAMLHAPRLVSRGISWEDRSRGNGNGMIDSAEHIVFSWDLFNAGSYFTDSLFLEEAGITGNILSDIKAAGIAGIDSLHESRISFSAVSGELLSDYSDVRIGFTLKASDAEITDSIFIVSGTHFEDFSSGNLSNFNWNSNEYPWHIDSTVFRDGPFAVRSGTHSHSSQSVLRLEVNNTMIDSVLFDFKVSSEKNYDFLNFYIDSVLIERWSGIQDWKRVSFDVGAGHHLLEWTYRKDMSVSNGEDAAWIDNISFPQHSFDGLDLGVLQILGPKDGKDLGSAEGVRVLVGNHGREAVHDFMVAYKIGESDWVELHSTDTIGTGKQLEIAFPEEVDLSVLASYMLACRVKAAGDMYPGNDSLLKTVQHYIYPDLAISSLGIDSVANVYADLLIEVLNEGNVFMEQWKYQFFLDSLLQAEDSIVVNLDPGEVFQTSLRLINGEDADLQEGLHSYLIESKADSLADNNAIEGSIIWRIISVKVLKGKDFLVYPNPAGTDFIVRLPNNSELPALLNFYDLEGRLINVIQMDIIEQSFSVGSLFSSEGVYILRAFSTKGALISEGKIIIRKD